MGKKGGTYRKKEGNPRLKKAVFPTGEDLMDDDIDAFHKQRDVVPLQLDEDEEESDDNEQPVFDVEDEEIDDEDDDTPQKGLAAKIRRTQKFLSSKYGKVEDEILDDSENEEQERIVWGRKKDLHGADVDNESLSSDDEDAAEEETEVLKLQRERATFLSMEDFGLVTASNEEPTFEEILDNGKRASNLSFGKEMEVETGLSYEVVKKDLNALTKEEQMNVVYSSAPELVGLLSELSIALDQLEGKITPLVKKIREQEIVNKDELHYLEVKQTLLLLYSQAITFCLLLKSEGLPVHDHPVISRLVEIKDLLDKMEKLDVNLPSDLEDIVNYQVTDVAVLKLVEGNGAKESCSLSKGVIESTMSSAKHAIVEPVGTIERDELNTMKSSKNVESQHKRLDKQIGVQSMEMLKVRAALEEKLKQKGVFSSVTPKNFRVAGHLQPVNKQFETIDDFDDEAMEFDSRSHGRSKQLSFQPKKGQFLVGDDDIPNRDDIGERRRKYELRVLAGAGFKSADDVENEVENIYSDGVDAASGESEMDSDLEYYKQVKQQHAAKLADKSDKYSRIPKIPSLPDTVDGKRLITHQMEKNRGLTRIRKKLIKNPRKKYKLKHKKAEVRRKGQVRDIRKPQGHYSGEATGINTGISRSIRFKS